MNNKKYESGKDKEHYFSLYKYGKFSQPLFKLTEVCFFFFSLIQLTL